MSVPGDLGLPLRGSQSLSSGVSVSLWVSQSPPGGLSLHVRGRSGSPSGGRGSWSSSGGSQSLYGVGVGSWSPSRGVSVSVSEGDQDPLHEQNDTCL